MTATADAAEAPAPEVHAAGEEALLVRFSLAPSPGAAAAAQRLARLLADDPPGGAVEIVPGLVSVLVRFDRRQTGREALGRLLRERAAAVAAAPPRLPDPRRRWTLPTAFGGADGPQLGEVAAALGLREEVATRTLCAADLQVLAIGFAPGQPYVGLLPEGWNLPRLGELTPRVPAGAVVVAVRQVVIFGAPSATGWRQVGRTTFRTFVPDRDPPMPLRAGDGIRFARVPAAELAAIEAGGDPLGGARLEILR